MPAERSFNIGMVKPVHELRVKIFADGADKDGILTLSKDPLIKGFTTNPTLMRKAGVSDYAVFAREVLSVIRDKPVSFEVFSDDFSEMERQARIISSWASNVYVKIPITNTRSEFSFDLVKKLAASGIKLNVTAILTLKQVKDIIPALSASAPAIISVFAGRIADTGVDPAPIMQEAKRMLDGHKSAELLWASPRELLNIYDAEAAGTDIITVTSDILKKLEKVGYDHTVLSLDTVKLFYEDGGAGGYTL